RSRGDHGAGAATRAAARHPDRRSLHALASAQVLVAPRAGLAGPHPRRCRRGAGAGQRARLAAAGWRAWCRRRARPQPVRRRRSAPRGRPAQPRDRRRARLQLRRRGGASRRPRHHRSSGRAGAGDQRMSTIREQALACRDAAQVVAALGTAGKRALLRDMAAALEARSAAVLAANAEDMRQAEAKGAQGAMLDRLRLDEARVAGIAGALREVAELPDPVGATTRREMRPNGLAIERVRIPLGVVAMIYEARPNVTADAAALCLMAGNGVILRGGS